MKTSTFICLATVGSAHAFSNIAQHLAQRDLNFRAESDSWGGLFPLTTPEFDAAAQYVDTTGEHAWKAPGKHDQRGPCPGLNALANHGYLPHNGIGTLDQFIDACIKVYGVGLDFATVLAVYPAVTSGNLVSFSIGGPDSRVSTLGLLGQPQGLSGSHNKFEGDSSPTRGDLYLTGNNFDLDMERFQALYDLGKEKDDYDLQLLSDQRYAQRQASIHENPYFFNAPFSGIVANAAAWCFIYRLMSNKTEENPQGVLNGDILKTFYAVSGEDGDFKYTRGHERIPDNWYTRNAGDAYTIAYLVADDLEMVLQHLDLESIGGNTGTVDSFTGVHIADLTGGILNAQSLLENNNLFCFAMYVSYLPFRNHLTAEDFPPYPQAIQRPKPSYNRSTTNNPSRQLAIQQVPDLVSGLFLDINAAVDKLGSVLNNATSSLGCPNLNNISKSEFKGYPGFTEEYDGYTPVAKLLGIL